MTGTAPTDMGLTDLAPFFGRYDRNQRGLTIWAILASLALSAVLYLRRPPMAAVSGLSSDLQWVLILAVPLVIAVCGTTLELGARARRKALPPSGRFETSRDVARNIVGGAKAAFVYNLAWTVAMVAGQGAGALFAYGYAVSDLIPRAILVVAGAGTICLGNVWPRIPTLRPAQKTPAWAMKMHRAIGWCMVIAGLLLALSGLFLPLF